MSRKPLQSLSNQLQFVVMNLQSARKHWKFVTTDCDWLLSDCTVGCVKNVSKRVFKNLLAFFAAILCILLGYLAKKAFQRIFDGGKLTSKRGPPIKKWKFHVAQTWACGVSIQRQWSGMLALCTQKSIWVSVSGEVAQKGQISKCTLIFALFGLLLQIRSPKLISECTAPTFQVIASG